VQDALTRHRLGFELIATIQRLDIGNRHAGVIECEQRTFSAKHGYSFVRKATEPDHVGSDDIDVVHWFLRSSKEGIKK